MRRTRLRTELIQRERRRERKRRRGLNPSSVDKSRTVRARRMGRKEMDDVVCLLGKKWTKENEWT